MKIQGYIFLTKDVDIVRQPLQDETENMTIETYSYKDLNSMIKNQQISDERTLLGFLLVKDQL